MEKKEKILWAILIIPFSVGGFYLFWHIFYRIGSGIPKEPYVVLNSLSANAATDAEIQWVSSEEYKGYVYYSTDPSKQEPLHLEETTRTKYHRISITNLSPNTTYQYITGFYQAEGISLPPRPYPYSFTTYNPDEKEEKSILLISDTQTDSGLGHMPLVQASMQKYASNYSLMILAGDIVDTGDWESYWNHFFRKAMGTLRTKTVIPAVGNHDGNYTGKEKVGLYPMYFGFPNPTATDPNRKQDMYHSVDLGNAIIIVLDFADNVPLWEEQIAWLNDTLSKAKDKDFRIVVGHRHIFNIHFFDISQPFIEKILPILNYYDTSLYIHGHLHSFCRLNIITPEKKNIPQISVGTGGGPFDLLNSFGDKELNGYKSDAQFIMPAPGFQILKIKPNKTLQVQSFNQFNDIIDEFTIQNQTGKIEYLSGLKTDKPKNYLLISTHMTTFSLSYFSLFYLALQAIVSIIWVRKKKAFEQTIIEIPSWTELLPFPESKGTNSYQGLETELSKEAPITEEKQEKPASTSKLKDFLISLSLSAFDGILQLLVLTMFVFGITILDKIVRKDCYEGKNMIQFGSSIPILIIVPFYFLILINQLELRWWRVISQVVLFIAFQAFTNKGLEAMSLQDQYRIDVFFLLPFIFAGMAIVFEFGGILVIQLITQLSVKCKPDKEEQLKRIFKWLVGNPMQLLTSDRSFLKKMKEFMFSPWTIFAFTMIALFEGMLWSSGLSLSSIFRLTYSF